MIQGAQIELALTWMLWSEAGKHRVGKFVSGYCKVEELEESDKKSLFVLEWYTAQHLEVGRG